MVQLGQDKKGNSKITGVGRIIAICAEYGWGHIWEGQFVNSLPQGFGRWICVENDDLHMYIGRWSMGEMHGYGRYLESLEKGDDF